MKDSTMVGRSIKLYLFDYIKYIQIFDFFEPREGYTLLMNIFRVAKAPMSTGGWLDEEKGLIVK